MSKQIVKREPKWASSWMIGGYMVMESRQEEKQSIRGRDVYKSTFIQVIVLSPGADIPNRIRRCIHGLKQSLREFLDGYKDNRRNRNEMRMLLDFLNES